MSGISKCFLSCFPRLNKSESSQPSVTQPLISKSSHLFHHDTLASSSSSSSSATGISREIKSEKKIINVNERLFNAASCGNLEEVIEAIKDGANTLAVNQNDDTVLNIAAHCGHLTVVRYFIELLSKSDEGRCAIIAPNKNGDTALLLAAFMGHVEIVREITKIMSKFPKGILAINHLNNYGIHPSILNSQKTPYLRRQILSKLINKAPERIKSVSGNRMSAFSLVLQFETIFWEYINLRDSYIEIAHILLAYMPNETLLNTYSHLYTLPTAKSAPIFTLIQETIIFRYAEKIRNKEIHSAVFLNTRSILVDEINFPKDLAEIVEDYVGIDDINEALLTIIIFAARYQLNNKKINRTIVTLDGAIRFINQYVEEELLKQTQETQKTDESSSSSDTTPSSSSSSSSSKNEVE